MTTAANSTSAITEETLDAELVFLQTKINSMTLPSDTDHSSQITANENTIAELAAQNVSIAKVLKAVVMILQPTTPSS